MHSDSDVIWLFGAGNETRKTYWMKSMWWKQIPLFGSQFLHSALKHWMQTVPHKSFFSSLSQRRIHTTLFLVSEMNAKPWPLNWSDLFRKWIPKSQEKYYYPLWLRDSPLWETPSTNSIQFDDYCCKGKCSQINEKSVLQWLVFSCTKTHPERLLRICFGPSSYKLPPGAGWSAFLHFGLQMKNALSISPFAHQSAGSFSLTVKPI